MILAAEHEQTQERDPRHNGRETLPTTENYLAQMHELALKVIASPDYRDPVTKYISLKAWKELVDGGILATSLGDRDPMARQTEILQIGNMLSYLDLSLGLTYGIISGLVIQPLERFAKTPEQRDFFLDRIRAGQMMGLGITEFHKSGSTALDMDSCYTLDPDGETLTVAFAKHLQGLSGQGDLIVAAVNADAKRKTIALIVVDQKDVQTDLTPMAGLPGVPYAVNYGVVTLNTSQHLLIEFPRDDLAIFQDIFTKSRLFFIGMVLGHLRRMEDEAALYASERQIGSETQDKLPVIQKKLNIIRAHRIIVEAMLERISTFHPGGKSLIEGDTTGYVMEADMSKVLSTEYALEAALLRAELAGGSSFYANASLQEFVDSLEYFTLCLKDFIDIYPFNIFEGSRFMLDTHIGKSASKRSLLDAESSNELFDRSQLLIHAEPETIVMLEKIYVGKQSKRKEEVLGQIARRCFALSCVGLKQLSPEDYELAVSRLNFEIQVGCLEYFREK